MHFSADSRAVAAAVLTVSLIATLAPATALADSRPVDAPPLTMIPLGSLTTGGAEIASYDPLTRQLYVTNADARTVTIVNIREPANPVKVGSIDVSAFGSPNSVAVSRGVVAVAIEDAVKTHPGRVGFYRTNGELLTTVKVGALPDMLTFSPDGNTLVVANEGEPSGYGAGQVDPEGSVSLIRMPLLPALVKRLTDADVRTVSFAAFIGQEPTLRARGIRIYGPGANAAQDFEPEYITVSPDSRTAYVTLQENNAIAKIDIRSARVTELLPLGYKDQNEKPRAFATYEWSSDELPSIGRTASGQDLRLGGFSGLAYEGVAGDGKLKFIANTDRGPNGEPTGSLRPFLLPQFTPRLVRFTLDPTNGRLDLTQQILLRRADGTPLTGLPNTAITGGTAETPHNDEMPVDLFGKTVPLDTLGADFEGIVVADDGSFWLPDEYRPALYHFDANGHLLERFIPRGAHAAAGLPVPAPGAAGALGIEALPSVLAQRRQNRGMEGIALKDGKLYGFVQSPARNPTTLTNGTLNALRNIRIVEFDPATRTTTRQFLYVMDNPASTGPLDTRADKIGDAVAVPGGFLALERDDDSITDDAASSDPVTTITKKIYRFALTGATDITAVDRLYDVGGGVMKSLDQMTMTELAAAGVVPVAKSLEVDLAAAGYASVQKVEGLALLDDGRLAVVNDNDFQVAGISIDSTTGTFTRLPSYRAESTVLGLITLPGLDASDSDSRINIRPWPVLGMYQPDSIGHYSVRGRSYLVTANEGDARDWPGLKEEERVRSLTLDPTAFPDGTALKSTANLGRLNVTKSLGDTDGDGDYDALYTPGGRSFTIWSTSGELVFDSGSALERITAIADPAFFNASNDNNNFDDRSDNKGPEPEGLALGEIGGRSYAFIGLERTGGIVAYDVTSPANPLFVDYVNNRDFSVPVSSPDAGDRGPEGVLFIPAIASPTFSPLLVVTNETSGNLTTYAVQICSRKRRGEGAGWLRGWLGHRFGWDSRCGR